MLQPNVETLKFKIGLGGTYWDNRPAYSILINGVEQVSNIVGGESDTIQYEEFTVDLEEDQQHTLSIRLNNKTDSDTIQNSDCTEIVKDMLLNIHSIEIDDIELGQLVWAASEFIADDNARPTLKNCVNLGWNGAYTLSFTTPFYLWLLENM